MQPLTKHIIFFAFLFLLGGCSTIKETVQDINDFIPSRWDANQSKIVTDIQLSTRNFDCSNDQLNQLKNLDLQIEWFEIYSQTKGTKDVWELSDTLKKTTKEYIDRIKTSTKPISEFYCKLKKEVMIKQADIIANTVQARW
jgi:PBP1b-binding outer membrane lipoprotein LpoB